MARRAIVIVEREVTAMDYPLQGVKVLDFSRVLAGPFVSRMLSDLGADVIKVEPPEGDMTRNIGRKINDISGYFTQQNVGKRSVCVDLTQEGASELLLALAAKADVVVENFRPGIMSSFGLGWEELSAVNPRLVMLSISGFGQTGPERDRASYAPIIHGEVGLLQRQQFVEGADAPHDYALSVADTYSGLHGMVGLMAALNYAQRTGIGQHVDLAMINAMFFTDDYAHFAIDGGRVVAGGGQIFDATGGPIMLAGDQKWYWHVLNTRAGVEDPTPEGADLETKIRLRRRAIEDWLVSFDDRESLVAELNEINLAWGNVLDHREVFERQGSVEAREILTTVDDRGGGERRVTNTPYRFSAAEAGIRGPAPYRGEHNYEAITDWLGDDSADLELLHDQGVLLQDEIVRSGNPPDPEPS
jgi:crotonobetainyl-CoA:carnitine CoA-transferase CaiB-like acyl-CoA transferase